MDVLSDDAEVLERSIAEPELFALVFDRHHAAVHRYLRRRLGTELADELLSETFVQALRARSRYRPAHPTCLPWLLGIAAHLISGHHRAERRRLAALEREAGQRLSDAGGGDLDALVARVDAGTLGPRLVAALRGLPGGDREALLLHVWGDLTYSEAAEALAVPVGTVRSRIHRARTRLRDALDHAPAVVCTGETDAR